MISLSTVECDRCEKKLPKEEDRHNPAGTRYIFCQFCWYKWLQFWGKKFPERESITI